MNSETITSTEPLWADGPSMRQITNEDGTYWVNPKWRDRYLMKAAALSKDMNRLMAARNLHPQTSAALSIRNRARAIHGVQPANDIREPNRYWPTDSVGLPGTLLHFEILDELTSEDRAAEVNSRNAEYLPKCAACASRTLLRGELCDDCHAALRFIQHQHDEAKANEQLAGRKGITRGEVILKWMVG